jgi:sarcosine oxidase subunit gamma
VPDLTLAPVVIASAWNVLGARAASEAQRLFGVGMPHAANTVVGAGSVSAVWLGPESWLIVSGAAPLEDYEAKRDALNAAGGALFDVSASRVAYALLGVRAADVLAAFCPLDLHPRAFPAGTCAQSVFGRVNALYRRVEGGFVVLVARSFGRDVWHGLSSVAREYGYDERPAMPWTAA